MAKSPIKIRRELEAANNSIGLIIGLLNENQNERRWQLGDECRRAIAHLTQILDTNQIPEEYRVAVVGRFKAGKSSFVNELLGRRLAGEDTSPETAAITTFRTGGEIKARISFIDKSTWLMLKRAYHAEPTDPEAQRVTNWLKFAGRDQKAGATTPIETFDLDQIEAKYVHDGGHELHISLEPFKTEEERRKAENEFRRKIRQYTSGSKPHHCLVQSIEIHAPATILGDGVALIDTPGLDDTERYRVELTERAVQDVDAILFLTKSGAAYGQSEKEFLLTLLRKGTIKQLLFVVTQVDQTYEQHVRQARDQDEEPESISERIEAERRRIRKEIEQTFDELDGEGHQSRYREQLANIEIAFTSAANHRDAQRKEVVRFPIKATDPGGMHEVKDTLYRILSTESRVSEIRRRVEVGTFAVLDNMLSTIEKRQRVVSGLRNKEVAEQKLATFRSEFEKIGENFAEKTTYDCSLLKRTLEDQRPYTSIVAEHIAQLADEILGEFESDDAGRHWKTRRSGRWGYMYGFQGRVANRIFPKVAEQLGTKKKAFEDYVNAFRKHLTTLSDSAAGSIRNLEIADEIELNVAQNVDDFLQEKLEEIDESVAGEEQSIVSILEEFVDEDVAEKISTARNSVAGVWGRGTTVNQTAEVRGFYREVRQILRSAIAKHIETKLEDFSGSLTETASVLPEQSLDSVRDHLDRASTDIKAAAEATLAGQKEEFERIVAHISDGLRQREEEIRQIFNDAGSTDVAPSNDASDKRRASECQSVEIENRLPETELAANDPDLFRKNAQKLLTRFFLRDGDKRWPYSRLFDPSYFKGATEMWLYDPYLEKGFQKRNLMQFLSTALDAIKLKTINIVTRASADEEAEQKFYSDLDKKAFVQSGTKVLRSIDSSFHDRFVILDNGVVFKLGRGLDIYKPPVGLSANDLNLRRVRECEIDVFAKEDFAMTP